MCRVCFPHPDHELEYVHITLFSPMLRIVASGYDGTLHGWEGCSVADLDLKFAFEAHKSAVRCLAVCGDLLATSSTDESIQLYDMKKRRVLDRLLGVHECEVSSLAFARNPNAGSKVYLISGDVSGRILVWTTSGCKVIHELRGHKKAGAVTSIAVHPDGLVALSTAKDNAVRMWDLVNAKAAPRIKLDDFKEIGCVCWAPGKGSLYALVADERTLLVFEALNSSGTPVGSLVHPRRINSVCFIEDVMLATAGDDGIVRVVGADGTVSRTFAQGKWRSRAVAPLLSLQEEALIVGAFSDGFIRVWDLNEEADDPIKEIGVGTGSHMTCLVTGSVPEETTSKRLKHD